MVGRVQLRIRINGRDDGHSRSVFGNGDCRSGAAAIGGDDRRIVDWCDCDRGVLGGAQVRVVVQQDRYITVAIVPDRQVHPAHAVEVSDRDGR